MTTRENMGISLLLSAVGRSVGIKPRSAATEPNKINGFVHESYGTAVKHEATLETDRGTVRLVTAPKLLEVIWPDADCRPCLRSIRSWTTSRVLPAIRIGGLVYYDVEQVRAALAKRTVKSH